jgi:hypothetical protein
MTSTHMRGWQVSATKFHVSCHDRRTVSFWFFSATFACVVHSWLPMLQGQCYISSWCSVVKHTILLFHIICSADYTCWCRPKFWQDVNNACCLFKYIKVYDETRKYHKCVIKQLHDLFLTITDSHFLKFCPIWHKISSAAPCLSLFTYENRLIQNLCVVVWSVST